MSVVDDGNQANSELLFELESDRQLTDSKEVKTKFLKVCVFLLVCSFQFKFSNLSTKVISQVSWKVLNRC